MAIFVFLMLLAVVSYRKKRLDGQRCNLLERMKLRSGSYLNLVSFGIIVGLLQFNY